MSVLLTYNKSFKEVEVELPESKSIANRLLIAQALSSKGFTIGELPSSEDVVVLSSALRRDSEKIDIGITGTAMRFLTAFYSIRNGCKLLTGDKRMKERPIGILVDKLRELGADIHYVEQENYAPLKIRGKKLVGGKHSIDASVSSQYISALLLIAPYMQGGLTLNLKKAVVSFPYIDMTLSLQRELGISAERKQLELIVKEGEYFSENTVFVEKDWSAASFFYQFVALSGESIFLKRLKKNSIQGDSAVARLFEYFGVMTTYTTEGVWLKKNTTKELVYLEMNLLDTPDLVQPVAVTASILAKKTKITGVSTLRIKETNRVEALKRELNKIGCLIEEVEVDEDTILIHQSKNSGVSEVNFECYNDHRMAMSLTPLVTVVNKLAIATPEVVVKSFPNFWEEIKKIGVQVGFQNNTTQSKRGCEI